MGKLPDDVYSNLFGLSPDSPEKDPLSNLSGPLRATTVPPPPSSNRLYDQLWAAAPPAPSANRLFDWLSEPVPPPLVPTPSANRLFDLLHPIQPSPAPTPKPLPPLEPGIAWVRMMVGTMLKRKVTVTAGRVLPGIEDLAVMEGRRVRAAFVYSDLHGFTKLVATQSEKKSFVFLNTFVEIVNRLTKHYNGQVMDCAGDRLLSVFHRSPGDLSKAPVEDAVTFALWLQTVFNRVIGPEFASGGLGQLSLGIGIDYGEAVVGCVGIRNNKRIVFFGDAANNAAKLQESAGPGETILSPDADARRPAYLDNGTWNFRREVAGSKMILRIANCVAGDNPPKVR